MKKNVSVSKIQTIVVTPIKTNDMYRPTPYHYTVTGKSDNVSLNNCTQNSINCEQIVIKPIVINIKKSKNG